MNTTTELHAAIAQMQVLMRQAADVIEHNTKSLAESHSLNGIIKDTEVQAVIESDADLVAHLRAAALPWDRRHKPASECLCKDKCLHAGAIGQCKGLPSVLAERVREPNAIVTSLTAGPDGVARSGLDRELPLMAGVYLAPQLGQQEPTGSMGMPVSCGKPLCSPGDHHPLCKLAEQPAVQQEPVCAHKKYSVDTATGKGNCLVCGDEGEMRFIVDTLTPAKHERVRELECVIADLKAECQALAEQPAPVQEPLMVDIHPPATQRDRWMYEQGRLAERDPRSHAPQPAQQITDEQVEAALKAACMHSTPESRKDMRRAIEASQGITKGN